MPNYRRIYIPGGTYFFTVNLLDRSSDLLIRHVDVLRHAYAFAQQELPFDTIAIAILPDHLHCLWQLPEGDRDFSNRWRLLKARFSELLPAEGTPLTSRGERNIWQRRFWEHAIRDERDLEMHVNYIHFNPVKHGYVTDVNDWPYSSWHRWKKEFDAALPTPADIDLLAGERS